MIVSTIEAMDYLGQLGEEMLPIDYSITDASVSDIIDDLLAYQVLTPAITKGTIEPTDSCSISALKGTTILEVLLDLRDMVGGYIEVDNSRQLQWLDDIGEDKGQQIRYRKNLKNIERETDYTTLVNRLYPEGIGLEGEKVMMGKQQMEETPGNAYFLYKNGYHAYRAGQRLTISNKKVSWLAFQLWKVGNPTTNIVFGIRKVSDDSVIVEETFGPATLISTAAIWYGKEFTPVLINEEVRIYIEFAGGNSSNGIYVSTHYGSSVVSGEQATLCNTIEGWTDYASDDLVYKYGIGYLEDTDSQSTYGGIYAGFLKNNKITDPDTLEAWAIAMLDELKVPYLSYRLNMVNLSVDSDFSFDTLQLGSIIKIIDEDLGIDIPVRVVSIIFPNLSNPENMNIELNSRVRDICNYLVDLSKA